MESPKTTEIKIVQPNEVQLDESQSTKSKACSFPRRLIWEALVVFLIFVTIMLFSSKWPGLRETIYHKILAKTKLAPNSEGFQSWLKPPVQTTRAYRLFDITNYNDIMTSKSSPLMLVQETTPFMYQLVANKLDPQWLEDNTKLAYGVERIFTRIGTFNDTLLNQEGAFADVPRAMYRTKFGRQPDENFFLLGGYNAFNYSKAIDKIEGYRSYVFSAISARMMGPNTDKYGFIYRYNGSNGFNYTIETGINNSSIKGRVVDFATSYSYFTTTADQWQTEFFDGLTFPVLGNPPNRKVINVFQPDFCRPVQLRYNGTVSKFGFQKLHAFVLKLVDVNECPEMHENCSEVDKLDISKCLSAEMPEKTIFLTKPHMYGSNASSVNIDFKPDFDKHESTIYFDTTSGSPVRAQLRLQLNLNTWIDRIKITKQNTTEYEKSRGTQRVIPLLWIDQTIVLNQDVADRLTAITSVVKKADSIHGSLNLSFVIVMLLIVIAVIVIAELYFWNRRRQIKEKPLPRYNEQEKALLNNTLPTSPPTT